jgi:hypothetical protein
MEVKKMTYSNELYHHGIKGMRWGIRRYQNKDGSLTPAGEKRRAKLEGKLEKLGGKKSTGVDSDAVQTANKKRASEMSDDELDKAIVRARKEDEYNRLRPEPVAAPKKQNVLINDVLKPAMINAGRNFMQNALNKAAENLLKGKVDPDSIEALTKTFNKLDLKNKIDKLQNPDKHLSEEDKNKRQQREFEAENREAQREGYQSVQDRAAKQKAANEAAEAAAKTSRLEAQRAAMDRAANDVVLNTFINKTTQQPTPRQSADIPKNVLNDKYVLDAGKSYLNKSISSSIGQTSAAKLSNSTVSSGEAYIERYGNVRWDGDLSKWSDE